MRRPWSYVRPYPPEEVTSVAPTETAPEEVGLRRRDVDAMWASVVALYRARLHPAIALCVRRHRKVVLERAIGHLHGNAPDDRAGTPTMAARYDSLFSLYSASKAITSMVIHLLDERRLVHLDDPIAEYVPEFGRHGKEWITIRHILTHRAGIPATPTGGADPSIFERPGEMLQILCDMKPTSVAGRRLAYHALTGGFLLGEIVDRVTGKDIRQFLRSEVLDPLGMAHLNYGVPPEEVPLVAENAYTGPMAFPPYSWLMKRSVGVPIEDAVRFSNDPRFLTAIVPSGNIVGTASEAGRFFELLLRGGELDGVRVFDRRTVARAVAETSYLEVDSFLGLPVRYGMGFMLGSRYLSIYGNDSASAFGHIGFTNVVAWADPARDLSVALLTSGKPFITLEQLHWLNVPYTIARHAPRV